MEVHFRNAFRKSFPVLLPYLGGIFIIMLVLLFPGLHWIVRLILVLTMIILALIVLGLIFQEIQHQLEEQQDLFVPLEPLPELDTTNE